MSDSPEDPYAAFTFDGDFVLEPNRSYEGCVPLELTNPQGVRVLFYAPPPETGQYTLDAIIEEAVLKQMSAHPEGARLDKNGRLYLTQRPSHGGTKTKHVFDHDPSIHEILQDLREQGYEIPGDYFENHENNGRLRNLAYKFRRR